MSSLFSHTFIPLAILFIFSDKLKLSRRNIIILSIFGILPDIDILTDHRASFHNIFILVIPILIFVFIRDIKIAGIISFYLISHLVLDIFNGGIFLLYPFYDGVFFSRIDMWFSNSGVTTTLDYGISKNIMSTKGEPMISSENIGTAILLIIFILVSTITRWYKHENKL